MKDEEKAMQPAKKSLQNLGYFDADMLEQALRISEKFFKAGCFGADVKNPEQAFVKIQAGAEMGMSPMEAMNSTYIVNGHIAIWGKALAKRLTSHGWEIDYVDCDKEKAQVQIEKDGKMHEYTARKEEVQAKQAYKIAPGNKLKYHALRQLINFNAPEVLGPISYTVEEIQDNPDMKTKVEVVSPGFTIEELMEELGNINTEEEYTAFAEKITGLKNIFTDDELTKLIKAAKEKKEALKPKPKPKKKEEKKPEAKETK